MSRTSWPNASKSLRLSTVRNSSVWPPAAAAADAANWRMAGEGWANSRYGASDAATASGYTGASASMPAVATKSNGFSRKVSISNSLSMRHSVSLRSNHASTATLPS